MIVKNAGLLDNDYENLEKRFEAKKIYKLADVQDKIERVAFDVVRFRDSEGFDKLWVIQEREGENVLVAMYDDDDNNQKEAKASYKYDWVTLSDGSGNVNVFYKGDPITRFSVASLGLPSEEAEIVCRYLPQKLASDKNFANSMLNDIPNSEAVFDKYPELKG